MTQIERTACFTGHREIPASKRRRIEKLLDEVIQFHIARGIIYYGVGGALGFDTMAAQAVIRARKMHPEVKLILVLPCRTQADRWRSEDKKVYESIKGQADKVVYISEHYTKRCMFERNRHLVEHSSLCICYQTKGTGGTAYTTDYAKSLSRTVVNIAVLEHEEQGYSK